jgi:hypothetical protein
VPSVGREIQADRVTVFTREPVIAAHEITTWALDHDIELAHFSVTQPTLEDIYLELTGSGDQHETTKQEVVR